MPLPISVMIESFFRYTYEIAPVVSMIEHLIVNKVGSELIGYPQVSSQHY